MSEIPTMAPVAEQGLHITVHGIGFTDEVDLGDIDRIVAAAGRRLAARASFTLQVGPPIVDSETINYPSQTSRHWQGSAMTFRTRSVRSGEARTCPSEAPCSTHT
ncbi:hypothetical protein GFY24_24080 [Nocardia sp. SYP-A9097]|uniref:hypothetical protein n=1 Tax=Nocardia sp. SYP-A9097 TaxID=2663237 RepID=UPI00129BB78F|nr:hypothetical protein [Nocardia sp. SYP-A9097]MRH90485.1 hypothetical protein [Nocardia sp. SYP-A9097]